MSPAWFLQSAIGFSFAALSLAMGLTLVRLFRGPTLCNRVVALDLITTLMVCTAGVFIIHTGQKVLLGVVIVAALITFLATVGYAYYVEREKK